jgi:hypothetical protein
MQCDTPKTNRLEKLNLMCNVVEKTSESKQKKGMNGCANNQALALGPTQNLKCVQCILEGK